MANEQLFAGGRLDSVTVAGGTPTEVTTAAAFDSSYADAAILLTSPSDAVTATFQTVSGGVLAASDIVSGETLYCHFDYVWLGVLTAVNLNMMAFYDSSGFPWFAIRTNGTTGQHGYYYNSNTGASPTWTQLGSSDTWTQNARRTYDVVLTIGSPHTVTVNINGSAVYSGTFTQASLTTLRNVRFSCIHSATQTSAHSQILCTRGISTIGAKVKTARATGAGTNAGFTSGAFTNVNEAINSDVTADSSSTAAQKQSYAMADVTVPAGYTIGAVWHWLRAKNDGAAPSNLKSLIRGGGTDYQTANLSGIGTSFAPVGYRYDTDPNTSAAWTQAGWNAAEAGYASAT